MEREKLSNQDSQDLLVGKIHRYRSNFEIGSKVPQKDIEQLYKEIIDHTARLIINLKGQSCHGILRSVADGTDSLGIANQRYVAKISSDVACRIAEIASAR